jgi:predicted flap endonuclease-1-like 5' DNA nuclease
MAAAAAAAMAAASASVTRGMRPIEPISPLSKVDPNILRPARLADALREKEAKDLEGKEHDEKGAYDGLRSVRSDALLSDRAPEEFDDLKRIRGIGVLIEKRLNALGVASYEQIANWTAADIERISEQLDFKGRIERENWVEQARILASGGHTEFSRRVDKGDVETSKS